MTLRESACVAAAIALVGTAPALADGRSAFDDMEFIGETFIPFELQFEDTTVEGLSGLTRIGGTDRYLAICDVTDDSPARFYELRIDVRDGSLDDGDVEVVGVEFLEDENGPLVPGTYDLEGIALDPGNITLLFASEGVGSGPGGSAPFITRNSRFGQFINDVEIDLDKLDQTDGDGGVFGSGGYESLVYSRNFGVLWAANETALQQDGERSTETEGSPARMFRYNARNALNPTPVAEYVYEVEPRNGSIVNPGDFGTGGGRSMVDLLPLNNTQLLALEREFIGGEERTNTRPIALYRIDTRRADNVIAVAELSGTERPVKKELILDFEELRQGGLVERVGSFEAMILGGDLDDGRKSLILVEDNDSAVDTQIVAFAVTPKTCDANFDDRITDRDIELIERATSSSRRRDHGTPTDGEFDARDANRDGYITRRDVAICRRK